MGPTLAGLRRSAAWPGESHAKGSARPTASGSRVCPSVAERSRTSPSPLPPEPRLPPLLSEGARALPDRLIGPRPQFRVKSRKAALSGPFEIRGENGRRDASGAGPRGCRDLGGLGGRSRSKMAAARRGSVSSTAVSCCCVLRGSPPEVSSRLLLFTPLPPAPFSINSEW